MGVKCVASINADRLLGRLRTLGQIGPDNDGHLTRLAASDTEKAGRDAVAAWIAAAGLEVIVDRIGNLFGIRRGADAGLTPVMVGLISTQLSTQAPTTAAMACWR
jgi:N-carbamoyl-L-amino-acid hydrolase